MAGIFTRFRRKISGGMTSYQNVLMISLKNWSKTSSKTVKEKVKAFLTISVDMFERKIRQFPLKYRWTGIRFDILEDWAVVSNCGGTMVDKKKTLFHGDETIEENMR